MVAEAVLVAGIKLLPDPELAPEAAPDMTGEPVALMPEPVLLPEIPMTYTWR